MLSLAIFKNVWGNYECGSANGNVRPPLLVCFIPGTAAQPGQALFTPRLPSSTTAATTTLPPVPAYPGPSLSFPGAPPAGTVYRPTHSENYGFDLFLAPHSPDTTDRAAVSSLFPVLPAPAAQYNPVVRRILTPTIPPQFIIHYH